MNSSTARKHAEKIREHFGRRIAVACAGSDVKPHVLAGFIFNECGRYTKTHPKVKAGERAAGDFNEDAVRFEPGVYEDLKSLRDRGFCFVSGRRVTAYNRIARADLQTLSDDALRNLSRSFGATQIMGWSMVRLLPGTIADLRDPEKHLSLAVLRIMSECGPHIRAGNREADALTDVSGSYGDALRVWNTGRPKGKTYHAEYVPNALAIMRAYKEFPALRAKPAEAAAIIDGLRSNDTEDAAAVVAPAADAPAVDDELEDGPETGEAEAELHAAPPSPVPEPTPTIEVPATPPAPPAAPEPANGGLVEKAKRAAVQIKAWHVALPSAVTSFVAGLYKWATDPANALLVFALLLTAGAVVVTFIVMNYRHSIMKARTDAQRQQEEHELSLLREKHAFELTRLQAESAADPNKLTVRIVAPAPEDGR